MDCNTLSWNIRGLNNPARRTVVVDFVRNHNCRLVCLQETKLDSINNAIIAETLGSRFIDNFSYLPAVGRRGGILIAGSSDHLKITPLANLTGLYSLTIMVTDLDSNSSWTVTGVYGPQSDEDKRNFLLEMRQLQTVTSPEWLILGDFNLISRADEKSNSNINLRMIRSFRAVIDDLGLKELPLTGRRFTWSNERLNCTLTKIDKALFSAEWEAKFPDFQMIAGSSEISDHCPLILKKISNKRFTGFRFEAWWPMTDGFADIVSQS
ncbi:uncharacterized protein [Aegilops tauschii subsp. strangulata]|uniref:uncharacterized protein n=1 Tax=Aegilops tauschii subsp. strangulata TaxID=200361 RepID=UPI003CC8A3F8